MLFAASVILIKRSDQDVGISEFVSPRIKLL
jgi:hypothetical protein